MKRLLLLLLILSPVVFLAQNTNKIPLNVWMSSADLQDGQYMSILVEGDPSLIIQAAKRHQGFVMNQTGNISSVALPKGQLKNFAAEEAVISVGHAPVNMQPLNDTMKLQTGVMDVRNGLAPLTQGYTGQGILMGIIDSGIDYTHPDFKDSLGNTRIYCIWDQRNQNGTPPASWTYGTYWDSTSINNASCTHNDQQYYGHGTHISGIGGGNGRSVTTIDMSGVAPDVVLAVVALDFNGAYSATAVADAAAFLYHIADSLNMPCVINASVGDYYGSHDGQDLQARMIDTLLDTPGRILVGAAGNAGGLPIHVSYTLSSDTNFTWFNSSSGPLYIQMWADTNNFQQADFSIGVTRTSTWTDLDRTPFTDIQYNLQGITYDTLYNSNNQRLATLMKIATIQGSAYSMEFLITLDSAVGYNYSLDVTGAGLFHMWNFDFVTSGLPSAAQYPRIVHYRNADLTHNIVSSFQCSDRVVTVGNYVNRDRWPNYSGNYTADTTVTAGEIMYNSSVGPTRDGRIKPDITAPGANSLSCVEYSAQPNLIANAPQVMAPGGFHVVGGGTSASSPVVAGCGALWLERFPNHTWLEYKNAVMWCAKQDTFTGNQLPDNTWGYGKIDIYSMMVNCALSTGNAPTATAGSPSVYPVPAAQGQEVHVLYPQQYASVMIKIYNASGQIVHSGSTNQNGELIIPAQLLSSGLYLVIAEEYTELPAARFVVE